MAQPLHLLLLHLIREFLSPDLEPASNFVFPYAAVSLCPHPQRGETVSPGSEMSPGTNSGAWAFSQWRPVNPSNFPWVQIGPPPSPEGSPVFKLENREWTPVEPLRQNGAHSQWSKTAEILQAGRSVHFVKDAGIVLSLHSRQEFLFYLQSSFLICTASLKFCLLKKALALLHRKQPLHLPHSTDSHLGHLLIIFSPSFSLRGFISSPLG